MRILFATNYRVGQTGDFSIIALQRMGIDLVLVTSSCDAPEGWTTIAPDEDICAFAESLDPPVDAFFMVESSTGDPFLPRRIDELPIPTALWLYDNYLNFRWNKEVVALFDYAFFAQLKRVEQARSYGRKNVEWLPFAADEKFHRRVEGVERDIDIGYIGSITGQKKRYFDDLARSGLTVTTNDRYLSYGEIGDFYSRCKLVYNILARRDMNVRTFEAPAAGALVVNQRWIDEGCAKIFVDGENMVFHDFIDAGDICNALLADDERRETMARAGEKTVMAAHTYRHRMQTVLAALDKGVTPERLLRRDSYVAALAEALTCQNRDFRWYDRARDRYKCAMARSPLGVSHALSKYIWWRIREKAEKIYWSFGRAPV